ncbi:CCAAT/enhancer-binding protein gamma [Elysia marginata]|uniref:CCAAT/enhancer-binding protein gamma n=1 Tax=Elysia marginata TaxID=1093978 RepID=A0AAV4EYF6_9GAST|nr:CCAAT/enhancer-binding protein gamma [Elysia marginata]
MPPKKSYESCDSESDNSQGQKRTTGKRQKLDKNSDEYRQRRERNNMAVKKSREASRKKAKETMDKVSKLRDENKALEQKVTILNKELLVLKDLFMTHASATATAQAATTVSTSTDVAGAGPDILSFSSVTQTDDNNDIKLEDGDLNFLIQTQQGDL